MATTNLPEESVPGISRAIQQVNQRVREFADTPGMLFLSGERGTEKSMVAKLLHQLSSRSSEPLGKLRVSWQMPPEMKQHVQHARNGTLVLLLQRELPIDLQYALVEYATSGTFEDPFTNESIPCGKMMLILMTSTKFEDLAMSRTSPVLPELRDILSERQIIVPPIRDRSEDIPALVRFALNRARETRKSAAQHADAQVLALFRHCEWTSNSEELLLVTAQAAMAAKGTTVTLDDLPEEFLAQVSRDELDNARRVRLPQPSRRPTRSAPPMPIIETSIPTPLPVREEEAPAAPDYENEPTRVFEAEPTVANFPLRDTPVTIPAAEEAPDYANVSTDGVPAPISKEVALPFPETAGVPAPAAAALNQLPHRLLVLARRLNSQSQLLSTQMSSPLAQFRPPDAVRPLEQRSDETVAAETLEEELQHGLDMVFALRRQLAMLNKRQRDSIVTFKDLVQRMNLAAGGSTETSAELDESRRELTTQLESINEIIDRVSKQVPKISAHMQRVAVEDEG